MTTPNPNFSEYYLQNRNTPLDWKEAQNFLNWYLQQTANLLNNKVIGEYAPIETPSGIQYAVGEDENDVFRKVFDLVQLNGGNIPADGNQYSFPHGITNLTNAVSIFGGATNTRPMMNGGPMVMPVPFATNLINFSIETWFDATNINIVNGSEQWDLSWCIVVAEYFRT